MRLISSETPCEDQQEEADRHHQPRRPDDEAAGVGRDLVPRRRRRTNTGHDSYMIRIAIGSRKNSVPKMSIQACARVERRPVMTSMRTCSLCSSV